MTTLAYRNTRLSKPGDLLPDDLIESGSVDAGGMVTHRFAFEQTGEAMDLVADYRDGVVKAMIKM